MKLEHISQKKLEKQLLKIFVKHLDLKKYKIFFFGSRVSGENSERSDIDVGIKGTRPIDLAVLGKIKDEIEELPILYKIDVVDFSRSDKDFQQIAQEYIEEITYDKV
ncbi:MAG: DNA polymerase beta domain-containing protein [Candidatus Berkelbacteria bacterium Licking1014_7]|uniref:DNA polymerase beta domain-containing protein n=1 Tax=Candidatus Berkelbacteria bacterium Licking1014_7 TaxID=2017147 RepID=A0A554LJC9_9BACT|nr:MAG: DNA polymerase beta domain-containing protein [Candidatus Berkelbacteria bacterium Licking1014_7]